MDTVTMQASHEMLIKKVVLAGGDLSKLTADEKYEYTKIMAAKLGLSEEIAPLKIIKIDKREVLYADKGTAEILRNKNKLTLTQPFFELDKEGGCISVTIGITDGQRTDYECGAVGINGLVGESYANAKMTALTKAKRRGTFSFLGLGMMDESELDSIPGDVSKTEVSENGLQVNQKTVAKAKATEESAQNLNAPKEGKTEPVVPEAKAEAPAEPKIDVSKIADDIDTVPAKDLLKRLDDYFMQSQGHDTTSLFNESCPRKPTTVKALIAAIAAGKLEVHLKEKYPHYKPKSKKNLQVEKTETSNEPDTSFLSEPGNNGRDMVASVKLAEFCEKHPSFNEEKVLEMYPDNFNDIEDFYKFATVEQITIALK